MFNPITNPAERLIVAIDLDPHESGSRVESKRDVLELVARMARTGVYIKVNSALRAVGYNLIDNIHAHGLKVFADLKLFDIGETLSKDGKFLQAVKPGILTVSCQSGREAMRRLKDMLPDTEVIGVAALTSLSPAEVQRVFGCSPLDAILRQAELALDAGLDGMVCSPAEVTALRRHFGDLLRFVTPAIRPEWSVVTGDDQERSRIATPAKALRSGSDRLVVGRPITQAKDPLRAIARTLEEVASVHV